MKTFGKLVLLVAVCCAMGFAQISSGAITSSNTWAAGPWTVQSGSGAGFTSIALSTAGCANCATIWGTPPPETRKLNAAGPTLIQVKNSAVRLNVKQLAPLTYATFAKSLGVEMPAEEAEILQAIHNADLQVYDFDKVDNYLYRQALKQGANMRWVWKPVRDRDTKPISESGAAWTLTGGVGFVYPKLYAQKVPMRVLADMKVIIDNAPDAVFMISDYEVVKPDPFLAVTTPKLLAAGKIWIIDQWDEPSFGTAPEPVQAPLPPLPEKQSIAMVTPPR